MWYYIPFEMLMVILVGSIYTAWKAPMIRLDASSSGQGRSFIGHASSEVAINDIATDDRLLDDVLDMLWLNPAIPHAASRKLVIAHAWWYVHNHVTRELVTTNMAHKPHRSTFLWKRARRLART